MAVDSAGYSTSSSATSPFAQSSLFSQKNYDPTGALTSGLQSAATYDPTTQTSVMPTSVAGSVKTVQSVNNGFSDQASGNQNLASAPVATSLLNANKNAYPSYLDNNAGINAASTLPQGFDFGQTLPLGAGLQVAANQTGAAQPGATFAGTASSGATGSQQAATNNLTQYGGPQLVSVRTASGAYAYYQFNATTGGYTYSGSYTRDGQPLMYQDANGFQQVQSGGTLTPAQRAQATLTNIGVGQQLQDTQAGAQGAALVAQQYSPQLQQWSTANQAAAANASATANAASQSSVTQQALDYMTTHGGQLPPELANVTDGAIVGNTGALQAQRDGIAAAQAQYAQQQAQAATLASIQPRAIDTSNIENLNQEALNSLISQYATSGQGGLASRAASNQATSLVGQNSLNRDTAAAQQYDTNLSAFGSALTQQNSYDREASGNQLYTDIQSVNDTASQLQQEISQLGTQARQQAQTQLDYLNQQIAQYRQAVQAYGQASGQAVALARGILGAASQVTASVTGK